MKRKCMLLLILAATVCVSCALADGTDVALPDGGHYVTIPSDMIYQQPAHEETNLQGIYLLPPDMEMLVFSYPMENHTVYTLAEALSASGTEAQVRRIGETDFLVFQDRDDADEAPCVGYSYVENGRMIEISFFYSTQAAMDLTVSIMESFR